MELDYNLGNNDFFSRKKFDLVKSEKWDLIKNHFRGSKKAKPNRQRLVGPYNQPLKDIDDLFHFLI